MFDGIKAIGSLLRIAEALSLLAPGGTAEAVPFPNHRSRIGGEVEKTEVDGHLSRVQLLWHMLALDLNLSLSFPGLRKIVTRLHAYPGFRGAAERLG